MKLRSVTELYDLLPENELLMVDVLRSLISAHLPQTCKEKISYNVPFFYGNKGICIIWPSAIPRGGITEGVLLGFWYGNRLVDEDQYLLHGTNKQIYYRIFKDVDMIEADPIIKLINEAVVLDMLWKVKKH